MRIFSVAAALAAALAVPSIASAATYDAVVDFSLTNNLASNTWSYWYNASTDVGDYESGLALNTVLLNGGCQSGTSCWYDPSTLNLILQNVTGSDVTYPDSLARNDQLAFYTRAGLELVRFTAPAASAYTISGFFEGGSTSPDQTTEAIAVNGGLILENVANVPFGAVDPFSFTEDLAAGETVDFFVAGISPGEGNTLATGFDATISSVPEPPTWAMLVVGFVGLGFAGFRSRPAAAHR